MDRVLGGSRHSHSRSHAELKVGVLFNQSQVDQTGGDLYMAHVKNLKFRL